MIFSKCSCKNLYEPTCFGFLPNALHEFSLTRLRAFCPYLLPKKLQVWALAVGKKTEMLATGGSDAVVNLWFDSTADDKEEAFRKEVSLIDCTLMDSFKQGTLCFVRWRMMDFIQEMSEKM